MGDIATEREWDSFTCLSVLIFWVFESFFPLFFFSLFPSFLLFNISHLFTFFFLFFNLHRFCAFQTTKMLYKKVSQMSTYCPLDLFSGKIERMMKAMKNLFSVPQNNLLLYSNGSLRFPFLSFFICVLVVF